MAAKNRRMFELRLGKLGLILFVSGMSLLLFSMFFLGIIVGKNMEAYPEKFSPGVVELIRDRLFASAPQTGKPMSSAESGKRDSPAGGEESFGLTFYETLGGKKTGAAANTAGTVKDETSEAPVPMTVPAEKPAIPGLALGSTTGTVGNMPLTASAGDGKKQNLPPERKPIIDAGPGLPTAIPPGVEADGNGTPGKERFEIQVAAYQDSRKAEKTTERLKPLGFAPQVLMKELPGKGKWFRVVIGGFDNREKAKAAADRIAGKVKGVKCVIRSSGKIAGTER
jgi:cell division protein FtsN